MNVKNQGTMNKKEKDNLLKEVEAAIDVIKAKSKNGVIEYYEIVPLKNKNTCEEIGFGVQISLNTNYFYSAKKLTTWKRLLKAKDFAFIANYGSLHVTFLKVYEKYARNDIYQLLR